MNQAGSLAPPIDSHSSDGYAATRPASDVGDHLVGGPSALLEQARKMGAVGCPDGGQGKCRPRCQRKRCEVVDVMRVYDAIDPGPHERSGRSKASRLAG